MVWIIRSFTYFFLKLRHTIPFLSFFNLGSVYHFRFLFRLLCFSFSAPGCQSKSLPRNLFPLFPVGPCDYTIFPAVYAFNVPRNPHIVQGIFSPASSSLPLSLASSPPRFPTPLLSRFIHPLSGNLGFVREVDWWQRPCRKLSRLGCCWRLFYVAQEEVGMKATSWRGDCGVRTPGCRPHPSSELWLSAHCCPYCFRECIYAIAESTIAAYSSYADDRNTLILKNVF